MTNYLLKEKCPYTVTLNSGEDDELEIFGYKRSKLRSFICWILIILTGGILRLVLHWYPRLNLWSHNKKCRLDTAERLYIRDFYQGKQHSIYVENIIELNKQTFEKMKTKKKTWRNMFPVDEDFETDEFYLSVHYAGGNFRCTESVRMFNCKQVRYIWDEDTQLFKKLKGLDNNVTCTYLSQCKGLTTTQQFSRRLVYGNNKITIPTQNIFVLLAIEALNPFYCFQVVAVGLWLSYAYFYYAALIILMSGTCIGLSAFQTKKNQGSLKQTVKVNDNVAVVLANGETEITSAETLVPGDIIEIPASGCEMHCDAVLLSGTCILDESMLTGESVPVTKSSLSPMENFIFNKKDHNRFTLYSGTKVLQIRGSNKVLAVVINTGNITAKGGLIRSILYPPPVDYKFEQEAYNFVILLAIIAGIGFFYTLFTKLFFHPVSALRGVMESLDLITIAVPTALPGSMTIGRLYAQKRLKKKNIYCISPQMINVSGSIDCVCFDKTGTLTEDGMDIWGVIPRVESNEFNSCIKEIHEIPLNPLIYGMASCHSITCIDDKLMGDPMDIKMFQSTGWTQMDNSENTEFSFIAQKTIYSIGILREFSFSSDVQRMSVITKRISNGNEINEVFCKGSPEIIKNLCRMTTIPKTYLIELNKYAKQGYRIIAIAYKSLNNLNLSEIQLMNRDEVECDLEFQGFLVFENRIKSNSAEVIKTLSNANIRSVMVTGDNLLTALSVAKICGIVKNDVILVDHQPNPNDEKKHELFYTIERATTMNTKKFSIVSLKNNIIDIERSTTVNTKKFSIASLKNDIIDIPNNFNYYQFALTGKTWEILQKEFPELLEKFVTRGAIFARMLPDQKQSLILELQALGYYVAMCGDGANDCGALKAAHTGISLSEAESSIASPFTSKNTTISCVPDVIENGRAALVTSFGIFKYMACYSLVQFAAVLILYSIESNLTDLQCLYVDLGLITVLSLYFVKTDSWHGPLVKQSPQNALMALSPMTSITTHVIVAILIQYAGWVHLKSQTWYVPFKNPFGDEEYFVQCVENYTIFVLSAFQFIILAFVFSKGKPYRQSILSNKGFTFCIIVNVLFMVYLTIDPAPLLKVWFKIVMPADWKFSLHLIVLAFLNFLLSILIETVLVDYFLFENYENRRSNSVQSKKKYLQIEKELSNNFDWPVT